MTDSEQLAAYRALNRSLAGLVLLGLSVPPVLMLAGHWIPSVLRTCWSFRFLGRTCPMCGITRGLFAVMTGRFPEACGFNPLALPVAALLVLELAYRGYAGLVGLPPRAAAAAERVDGRLHAVLLLLYLVYAAWFVLSV